MPPSGYEIQEAIMLKNFVLSNAARLIEEADQENISYGRKISNEMKDISASMMKMTTTTTQKGALYLSYSLYENLAKMDTKTKKSFYVSLEIILKDFVEEIRTFKV